MWRSWPLASTRRPCWSRFDEAEWKVADLHQGLEDTLTLIHHRLQNRIEVIRKYGDLPAVACYPKKMNQVFMVLLMNATQAIDGRGEITIETSQDNDQASSESPIRAGGSRRRL